MIVPSLLDVCVYSNMTGEFGVVSWLYMRPENLGLEVTATKE